MISEKDLRDLQDLKELTNSLAVRTRMEIVMFESMLQERERIREDIAEVVEKWKKDEE